MMFESLDVDVRTHTELYHVGDYKYLAVDRGFDIILASFDTRSDLSKWVLAQQDSKGTTENLFWLCRMTSVEYMNIRQEMTKKQVALRGLIAVRETSY